MRSTRVLAVAIAAVAVTFPASAAMPSALWPAQPNWQQYVLGPAGPVVRPVAVVSTSGSVGNAAALTGTGTGVATLTRHSGETTPTDVVLDYGRDVGGLPSFDVAAESGSPQLRAGFSESRTLIGPTGDGAPPFASGDPQRYDTYSVTAPGTITNTYVQGGERYEEISLLTPGSVSLRSATITFEAYLAGPDDYTGWFDSSSDQLNKIWYAGAYTVQLDQAPPDTMAAGIWNTDSGYLRVTGTADGPGLLNAGASWTDYTLGFRTRIEANQAGWFVRARDAGDGYLLILDAANDTVGPPNTLQEIAYAGGKHTTIRNVPLPFSLAPGSWHDVRTVAAGNTVTTYVDGTSVASFTSAAYSSGTIGVREYTGERADFSNLTVTSAGGQQLYSNALADRAALAGFTLPDDNALPAILDGAKRDRAIWSGDLAVAGPTAFYSTDTADYLRESLRLLGSYAGANGYVSGYLRAQTPLHTGPPLAKTFDGYSASYSMYFVHDLAEYYLYTGDTQFVAQEWPVVQAELGWSAAQVDSHGLLVTNSSDGNDWDYYDGAKLGEVTEYNALYYQTLLDGVALADALGNAGQASQYQARAAALDKAINANLFDTHTGVYDVSNQVRGTIAQDANALAVEFGVAPASRVAGILAVLKRSLWTSIGPRPYSSGYQTMISPFVSGAELTARLRAGDTADAMQLLSDVWGPMVVPGSSYTGTLWENRNLNGTLATHTSLAHGWSTTPTAALSGLVLGVEPVGAGFSSWQVQPHPGTLAWAQGRVPTPHGAIGVAWGQDARSGRFEMDVDAPAGTTGTIAVPTSGQPVSIQVDGQTVWAPGRPLGSGVPGVHGVRADGDYVEIAVDGGSYTITSQPMYSPAR